MSPSISYNASMSDGSGGHLYVASVVKREPFFYVNYTIEHNVSHDMCIYIYIIQDMWL